MRTLLLTLLVACGADSDATATSGAAAGAGVPFPRSDPGLAPSNAEPRPAGDGVPAPPPAAPPALSCAAGGTPLLAAGTWGAHERGAFVLLTVDAMDPAGMAMHPEVTTAGATVGADEATDDGLRLALHPDAGAKTATVDGRFRCGDAERPFRLHLDLAGARDEGRSVPTRLE